jgi:hypothetical protein
MGKIKSHLDLGKKTLKDARRRELTKLRNRKYREKVKSDPERYKKIKEATKIRGKKRDDIEREERSASAAFKRVQRAIWRQQKMNKGPIESASGSNEVEWNSFMESLNTTDTPKSVSNDSQQKRRKKERRHRMIALQHANTENEMLKKKVKSLKVQLSRKRKADTSVEEVIASISSSKVKKSTDIAMKSMPKDPALFVEVTNKLVNAALRSPRKKTIVNERKRMKPKTFGTTLIGTKTKSKLLHKNKPTKRMRQQLLRRKRASKVIWRYKVEMYLASDTVSKQLPGSTVLDRRRQNVNRKYRQKKGLPITKRVLRNKMSDLFVEFKADNPKFPYCRETFYKMKPKFVITAKIGTKKEKRICVYHSNMTRKLEALNKFCRLNSVEHLKINSCKELIDKTVCEHIESKYAPLSCIERSCTECGTHLLMDHYAPILGQAAIREKIVLWSNWTNVDRVKLNKRTAKEEVKSYNEIVKNATTFEELLHETMNDTKTFAMHEFRMRWQWNQLHELTEKLPADDILLIMDFSENIGLQFSEETIASHSKCFSLSLFPVAVYHRINDNVELEAVLILSDDLCHDNNLVRMCTEKVMDHMKTVYPDKMVRNVHRFSDGCASQFKSRHTMRDIAVFEEEHGCSLTCNYGETSEFKNVCDGMGDHIKTPLTNAIIRGDLVLSTPFSYYEYAKKHMTFYPESRGDHKMIRRTFYFLNKDEVNRDGDHFGKPLPGVMKVRSVLALGKGFIGFRKLSCYCNNCIVKDFKHCQNTEYVELWQINHVRKEAEPSCCTPKEPCLLKMCPWEKDLKKVEVEEKQKSIKDSPIVHEDVGQFVSVLYESEWYLGKVLKVDMLTDRREVMCMAGTKTKGHFVWTKRKDICWYSRNLILDKVQVR